MSTGAYISGGLHVALILWLLLGGALFSPKSPEMVDSTNVTLLSSKEFRALVARPEPVTAQDVTRPEAPQAAEAAPKVAATQSAPVEASAAPSVETPPAKSEQVPSQPELPTPVASVDATDPTQPIAPPAQVMAALVPPTPDPGTPKPMPRAAPVPHPETAPQAEAAPENVPAIEPSPSPAAKTPPVVQQPAKAPKAATSEVAAETPDPKQAAPITALRPPSRPETPKKAAETPKPKPAPPTETPSQKKDIADALAAAGASQPDAQPSDAPAGPPLSYGEVDALKVAMSQCWNKAALSSAAERVTVVIGMKMTPDGKPVPGSIHQISATGGDSTAIRNAYETASRAIRLCGARGLPLPPEKYASWAQIEMTFNPSSGLGVN